MPQPEGATNQVELFEQIMTGKVEVVLSINGVEFNLFTVLLPYLFCCRIENSKEA